MRAWVISDLHVDAAGYDLPSAPADIDVVIIAGDVADGHRRSLAWLRDQTTGLGVPVVYVCGNHDFFGEDLSDDHADRYREAGIELLHPGRPCVEIAGVRIIGSTLWTDYAIAGDVDQARFWARQSMPDFVSIDVGLRRIGTRDLLGLHHSQRTLIEHELAAPFTGSTIVVTHHAPHPCSMRNHLIRDTSDGSFVSDLSAVIEQYEPAVWIHGHVHDSHDYYVGATRIVCNPRGYAIPTTSGRRLGNRDFIPGFVVEI